MDVENTIVNNANKECGQDDLRAFIDELKKEDAFLTILHNNDCEFMAMYFETKDMQKSVNFWFKYIAITKYDAFLNNKYFLYVISVLDNDNELRIIRICFSLQENEQVIEWLISKLRSDYQNFTKIKIVFIDDSIKKYKFLVKNLLKSPVYTCSNYNYEKFEDEITPKDFKVTKKQRNQALKFIKNMISSDNLQIYEKFYQEFCKSMPSNIVEYFNEKWHAHKTECSDIGFSFFLKMNENFENLENNLWGIKNKQFLTDFVRDFFLYLFCFEEKQEKKISEIKLKRNCFDHFQINDGAKKFNNYLTNSANNLFKEKMLQSNDDLKFVKENNKYYFEDNKIITDINTCTCNYYRKIELPCEHILKVRKTENVNLYDESLISDADWTQDRYIFYYAQRYEDLDD